MIRVMIVEDQKLVRSLLESYIQNEDGYQLAVSIPGAAEAPILCDTEDIDLVLDELDAKITGIGFTDDWQSLNDTGDILQRLYDEIYAQEDDEEE